MKKVLAFLVCLFFLTTLALSQSTLHYRHKAKNQHKATIPIDAAILRQKLSQTPPSWMLEQIRSDLSAYEKTGITEPMLNQLFQGKQISDLNLIRFTIKNGHISFSLDEKNLDSRQFRHLLSTFQKLNEITPLPDVDFVVSLHDGFLGGFGSPLFVYAKANTAQSLILMPDFKALTGYPSLRQEMESGSQKFPWEKKVSKAFWRGATTGGWLTADTWDQIARCKLVLLSLDHPEKIDARIHGIVQCDPEIPSLLKSKAMVGNRVEKIDHLKYKYLVDVDGNSCSFERYFWVLLSNSLVLKQITPNIQWYYNALRPYEHFVPVKEDLSDLVAQLEWAKNHDEEAKKISENATAFVKNNLSTEDTFLYMTLLLQEYAKLQSQYKNPY